MDIISRIREYIEYFGLTYAQFADRAGIPRPTLSQLFNGRNKSLGEGSRKVSSDIIRKIHEAYPDLNMMWLLFGDGSMINDSNIQFSKPKEALYDAGVRNQSVDNQVTELHSLFDDEISLQAANKNVDSDVKDNERAISQFSHPSPTVDCQNAVDSHLSQIHALKNCAIPQGKSKKVKSIMIFYDDNSFEVFNPA